METIILQSYLNGGLFSEDDCLVKERSICCLKRSICVRKKIICLKGLKEQMLLRIELSKYPNDSTAVFEWNDTELPW